ncbi:hypothetical protein IKD48_00230 [bacterium]|nr:hypothetical protein [bacterium]
MTTRTSNTPYTGTFANMSQLKEITLPASCSQFGVKDWTLNTDLSTSCTFTNCTSLKNLNFKNFTLKTTSSVDANGNPTQTPINTFEGITRDT